MYCSLILRDFNVSSMYRYSLSSKPHLAIRNDEKVWEFEEFTHWLGGVWSLHALVAMFYVSIMSC